MSSLYTLGRQGLLDGSINWLTGTQKVMLVSVAYTPNLQTDEYVAQLPPASIIARSAQLTNTTATGGVARAANVSFTSVTGAPANYLVVYQDTGNDATARLIALIDTGNGLPVTPNGGPISIAWDTGPYGIFMI